MVSTIQVNGESHAFEGATVEQLLRARGVDVTRRGVAVALNGAVVPKSKWPITTLKPGDELEIVKPFSGG